MPTNTSYAIIVAGGSGSRMQSALPKQFLLLNQLPVMMHTLQAFAQSKYQPQLLVVLPQNYHAYWQQLCQQYQFTLAHTLVAGGQTRFHSVLNGLNHIKQVNNDALVAVHDAVRPLVSPQVIDDAYTHALQYGNAVVAVQSRDSVRRVVDGQSAALPRNQIYLVQTPQTFRLDLITRAYQQPYTDFFTDDASVVEQLGEHINLVDGHPTNIKITFPEDIAIAETILQAL